MVLIVANSTVKPGKWYKENRRYWEDLLSSCDWLKAQNTSYCPNLSHKFAGRWSPYIILSERRDPVKVLMSVWFWWRRLASRSRSRSRSRPNQQAISMLLSYTTHRIVIYCCMNWLTSSPFYTRQELISLGPIINIFWPTL